MRTSMLRFGIVGAGEIAVASAEAVRDAPHAELAAIFDANSGLAEDLAARTGARAVGTLEDLLAAPDVDAVYVCLPHFLHRDAGRRAAAAGKHLFIEKPMGTTTADAEAIVRTCRDAGVACGVPLVVREAPAYRAARNVVASGAIGDVRGFRISYRGDKPDSYWTSGWSGRVAGDWRRSWEKAGGGVLLMNAIHDLDAILWITQLGVDWVRGAIETQEGLVEVEHTALAILGCSGGALGSIEGRSSVAGSEGPSGRWVNRIYGSVGQILLPTPWGEDALCVFTRTSGEWTDVVDDVPGNARMRSFESFARAVLEGREPPVTGQDCLRASRIVHAIYDAARRGSTVDVSA